MTSRSAPGQVQRLTVPRQFRATGRGFVDREDSRRRKSRPVSPRLRPIETSVTLHEKACIIGPRYTSCCPGTGAYGASSAHPIPP